ncbi:MAG TPA: Fe2+-enterobactin ABC transporter substrate-binding protein, partial [Shigella sp.]|nr:Fe2+-enterobactin ABC transporter substrate-binding protein [Shigella sp.]
DADAINANRVLARRPAVQNKQFYARGTETFRLDYYSAMQVLDRLKALF